MGGAALSATDRGFKRKFFEGFSFKRFLVKSNGVFFAVLGGGSALADWSYWATDMREAVRSHKSAIFVTYAVWEGLFFAYEMLRLKLRQDLAHARWENRMDRAARKRKA